MNNGFLWVHYLNIYIYLSSDSEDRDEASEEVAEQSREGGQRTSHYSALAPL